jgi:hypothetical protein
MEPALRKYLRQNARNRLSQFVAPLPEFGSRVAVIGSCQSLAQLLNKPPVGPFGLIGGLWLLGRKRTPSD